MSTLIETKIKKFLNAHKPGTVCLASWLEDLGISHDLQKRYRKSGWLASIGRGAYKRPEETIHWPGGLYALQYQANLPVHAGALTALVLWGMAHYARMGKETIYLFSPPRTKVPGWFNQYDWGQPVEQIRTAFLPENQWLVDREEKTFSIKISVPERAMLECLYLAPAHMDMVECYHLMEGLANLRPRMVQSLLEACASIKVKRLFLYMAEKAGHQWVKFLNQEKFDLGKGDRGLTKGGVYVPKYRISVPRELSAL